MILAVILLVQSALSYAKGLSPYSIIRVGGEGTVSDSGDLKLTVNWRFPTAADYLNVKSLYPSPYVLMRELFSGRASFILENKVASYSDATSSVYMTGLYRGAAVGRRRQWELEIGKDLEVAWQAANRIVLVQLMPLDSYFLFGRHNIVLPAKATNVQYSSETGLLTYTLALPPAPGSPDLGLDLKCKPRIMSAAYKVYGHRELGNGAYWLARLALRNQGRGSVRDLQISYRLGEYSDWSEPSQYATIRPGGVVCDLYYPIFAAKITELRTQTPVDLQVRLTYKDEAGRTYSESMSKRVSILGVNQFETSNILPEESTGTWADLFSNAPLLAIFATRLDDPVKAFAGLASQEAGGAGASLDDDQALKFCKALYDLEVFNGISYQTPSGFLTEYATGQDLKFPRDVLRDKAGTCVDLALLYASACEAVGLKSRIMLIPGHAYPVIELPSGDWIPVETTKVRGAAVGDSGTFAEAVKTGQKSFPRDLKGPHFLIPLEEAWNEGISNPELPRLETDVLQRWGYKRPEPVAEAPAAAPNLARAPAQAQPVPVQPGVPPPGQGQAGQGGVANAAGTYSGRITITQGPYPGQLLATMTIQQAGTAISGQLRFDSPAQGVGRIDGQVRGNLATFYLTYGGYRYEFQAVLQGGSLQGRFTSDAGEEGEFLFSRV